MMCRIKKSIVLVAIAVGIVFAQGVQRWRNLYPAYNGLAFGADKFVAVTGDGLIRTTQTGDGEDSWSQFYVNDDDANSRRIFAVVYGGGRFVAVQNSSRYLQSTDGAAWSPISSSLPSNKVWKSIVYGSVGNEDNYIVADATGHTESGYFDSDRLAWDQHDAGIPIAHAAFGGGQFVAVGNGIRRTATAAGWGQVSVPSSAQIAVVAFDNVNNKFVALSKDGSTAYTSTASDIENWSSGTATGAAANMADMTFGNGKFVAVGAAGKACVSGDGTAWTTYTLNAADNFTAVKFGNNAFLALGAKGSVYKSDANGANWSPKAGHSVTSFKQIVYGGDKFVAVGDSGVSVSDNGKDWERKNSPKIGLTGVAYGAGKFVAVGSGGTIIYSVNGDAWTDCSVDGDADFTSVASNGTKFIAGGKTVVAGRDKAVVYVSDDGSSWGEKSYMSPDMAPAWKDGEYVVSLCFGNGKFLAAVGGSTPTSPLYVCDPSGANFGQYGWSVPTLPEQATGYKMESAVYADNKFVVFGTKSNSDAMVFHSADAENGWASIAIQGLRGRAVTHAKGAYIAVGDSGAVFAAMDNNTSAWFSQGKPTNRNLTAVYSGNNKLIAAGAGGVLLYSEAEPTSVRHASAPRAAAASKNGVMRLVRSGRTSAVTLSFTPNGAGTVAVYSLSGRQLYMARLGAGERSASIPERVMPNGSVIVRYSGGGRVVNQRFQTVR